MKTTTPQRPKLSDVAHRGSILQQRRRRPRSLKRMVRTPIGRIQQAFQRVRNGERQTIADIANPHAVADLKTAGWQELDTHNPDGGPMRSIMMRWYRPTVLVTG